MNLTSLRPVEPAGQLETRAGVHVSVLRHKTTTPPPPLPSPPPFYSSSSPFSLILLLLSSSSSSPPPPPFSAHFNARECVRVATAALAPGRCEPALLHAARATCQPRSARPGGPPRTAVAGFGLASLRVQAEFLSLWSASHLRFPEKCRRPPFPPVSPGVAWSLCHSFPRSLHALTRQPPAFRVSRAQKPCLPLACL